jgi:hypothetical protein
VVQKVGAHDARGDEEEGEEKGVDGHGTCEATVRLGEAFRNSPVLPTAKKVPRVRLRFFGAHRYVRDVLGVPTAQYGAMAVPIVVEKTEDAAAHCVYAFGGPEATVGRARLEKETGAVELLALDERGDGPSEQFYLAHVVARLQGYHDRGRYPAREQWEA